jgi:hypothetical protein
MNHDPHKLINLSVHKLFDPSLFSPNPDKDASGDLNNLNHFVYDEENFHVLNPRLCNTNSNETLVARQVGIASLGSG